MDWIEKDNVVVPIDFSDASVAAVQQAVSMARSPESVRVIHVLPVEPSATIGALWQEDHEKFRHEHATKHMSGFLNSNGINGVRQDILVGDPGTTIVRYAKDADADLIVMPSHGYHGLKRLLLGSVTERVLRHAHCPVFVLRREAGIPVEDPS